MLRLLALAALVQQPARPQELAPGTRSATCRASARRGRYAEATELLFVNAVLLGPGR